MSGEKTTEGSDEEKGSCCENFCTCFCCCFHNCLPHQFVGYWFGLGCCGPTIKKKHVPTVTPFRDRVCTDVICLLIFFAFCAAEIGVSGYVYYKGTDITTVWRGRDYRGQICSDTNPEAGGSFYAFPDLTNIDVGICVQNCAETLTDPRMITRIPPKPELYSWSQIAEYYVTNKDALYTGYESTNLLDAYCVPDSTKFPLIMNKFFSNELNGVTTKYSSYAAQAEQALEDVIYVRWWLLIVAGLSLILCFCWGVILKCCGKIIIWVALVALLAGLGAGTYYTLYQSYVVRTGAVCGCALDAALTVNEATKCGSWPLPGIDCYQTCACLNADILFGCGVTIGVIGFLYMMLILCSADRINIAVKVAQEAVRAVDDMPELLTMPFYGILWTFLWIGAFGYTMLAYWTEVPTVDTALATVNRLSLCSLGYPDETTVLKPSLTQPQCLALHHAVWNADNTCTCNDDLTSRFGLQDLATVYKQSDWWDSSQYDFPVYIVGFLIMLFTLFFQLNFSRYVEYMTKAGAFSEWYFAVWEAEDDDHDGVPDKNCCGKTKRHKKRGGDDGVSCCPCIGSYARVVRFHLGTVAFGAFLIALIEIVQVVILYIQNQLGPPKDGESRAEKLKKAVFACIQCMLQCIKKCIDKLNKGGFIYTSVYGTPYCTSGARAFWFKIKNIGRVAILAIVQRFFTTLGIVCVVGLSLLFTFTAVTYYPDYSANVTSALGPAIASGLVSISVAGLYMYIYQTGIDTIFLCFLIDEDISGKGETNLMHPRFATLVDEHGDDTEEMLKNNYGLKLAHEHASRWILDHENLTEYDLNQDGFLDDEELGATGAGKDTIRELHMNTGTKVGDKIELAKIRQIDSLDGSPASPSHKIASKHNRRLSE